jgi:hypothetical protein
MNGMRMWIGLALIALAALLLLAGAAWANGPGHTLDWWTVDGGGGTWSRTSGQYELNGTAGQPDAALWQGQGYTLTGGFWGGAVVQYRVYLPLVLRD